MFFRPFLASFLIGARVFLFVEVRRHAAALDHESRDDAMEYRAVEESVIDVAQEILVADGRLLREQLDREGAVGGFESDHGLVGTRLTPLPSVMRSCPARSRCERT